MDFGMLWYDDDKKRPLEEKVQRAADYYKAKYGEQATECAVNPSALGEGAPTHVGPIRLRGLRQMIKDHFWLGQSTPAEPGKQG